MASSQVRFGQPLSWREVSVLTGMSHGRSNGEIGEDMYLSEHTIKTHASRLFRKLGARDRAHAVRLGIECGVLKIRQLACQCSESVAS